MLVGIGFAANTSISGSSLYITAGLSLTSSFSISKAITVRFPPMGKLIYPLVSTDP